MLHSMRFSSEFSSSRSSLWLQSIYERSGAKVAQNVFGILPENVAEIPEFTATPDRFGLRG